MSNVHGCGKMFSSLMTNISLNMACNGIKNSFPKRTKKNKLKPMWRTSSCTRAKASYTIEAAVIIPIVAGFLVALMFFFRVMQIQTEMASALSYASRCVAVEASTVDSETALLASSQVLLRKQLAEYPLVKRFVSLEGKGVSLIESEFDKDHIILKANYYMKLPIGFFGVKGIHLSQNSCSRKWTGMNIGGDDLEPYVYYTDTGTVYHLTDGCPYLDLTIRAVKHKEIEGLRNKNGARYSSCSRCAAKINDNDTVYITDYGTAYHSILNCSALKRTIHMVKLSEVGNRSLCSKCGGKE